MTMTTTMSTATAILLTLSMGISSAENKPAEPVGAGTGQTPPGIATLNNPVLQQRNPRYKIMWNDVLNVSFALTPELTQTVKVQPDGFITLRGIGSFYAQGMTVPELVEAVKKNSANILHNPIVDVDLVDFQKPFFVVAGQVNKPGQYDLRADITVSEAIAFAGGFLPTAKTQVLLYHRVSDNWVEVKNLKLKDILSGKNVEEDVQMRPGDMIFVPEKFIAKFRKYVPYSPGFYLNPMSMF
jgi:polysaccharide biosynthesis/export protein